jgi:hypothetical protein
MATQATGNHTGRTKSDRNTDATWIGGSEGGRKLQEVKIFTLAKEKFTVSNNDIFLDLEP